MARAIDADAFMKEIRKWLGNETDFRSLQEVIAGMPTIDPVKHGKWNAVLNRILVGRRVATQGTAWECSACNNSSKQYLPTMKFCPNCGARMDGE